MGKRMLSLYVDDDVIREAKLQHMNMSRLFNQMLSIEIKHEDHGSDKKLKLELAKAREELLVCKEKLAKQDKLLYDKKRKDEGWRVQT